MGSSWFKLEAEKNVCVCVFVFCVCEDKVQNTHKSLLMVAGASQPVASDDRAAWKHVAVTEVQCAGLCSALRYVMMRHEQRDIDRMFVL